MQHIDTFRGEPLLGSWTYRITANTAYQNLHAIAKRLEEPLGGGGVAPTQRFDERQVTVYFRGDDPWIGRDVELGPRAFCIPS